MILDLFLFSLLCFGIAGTFTLAVNILSKRHERLGHNRPKKNVIKIFETTVDNKNADRKN